MQLVPFHQLKFSLSNRWGLIDRTCLYQVQIGLYQGVGIGVDIGAGGIGYIHIFSTNTWVSLRSGSTYGI